jgi:hypothetical protein
MTHERFAGDFDAEVFPPDLQHALVPQRDGAMQGIEDLFSLAAIGDHVIDAKQPQVMAHGWLGKLQLFADRADVSLALGQG